MTHEAPDVPLLEVRHRPLHEVIAWLRQRLATEGRGDLLVPDPDEGEDRWPGEPRPDGLPGRDWRAWLDLADGLGARMRTPRHAGGEGPSRLRVPFVRLGGEAAFHGGAARAADRYEHGGTFARIRKMAHPGFLLPLLDALAHATSAARGRTLLLGCHRGDEIDALTSLRPAIEPSSITGVDQNEAALAEARRRFPGARFVQADLAALPADLGRFELIVAIDVLQSPALDGKAFLHALVREHAAAESGVVVGLPCSRFRDGTVVWGARTRNYREPDLSLVVRDLAAHRRYLHRHGYRCRITGRYDLLLSAVREASGPPSSRSGAS